MCMIGLNLMVLLVGRGLIQLSRAIYIIIIEHNFSMFILMLSGHKDYITNKGAKNDKPI